jgi:DNA-binding CsgD family transcriptional regulator
MDRARSTRRAERERVLELWRTLHERRWTLVDVFDTDGRRFLVARENAPATPPHAKLTQRERQVTALLGLGLSNKAIAYELGLSPSTVATLVGRARAKLDLESVPELVRWARATYTRTESVDQIPDKNRASSRRE